MNTTTSPDEYRLPQNPVATQHELSNVTHEELRRLIEVTKGYAGPSHNTDPTDIDSRRVEEFGSVAIDAATVVPENSPETTKEYIQGCSQRIIFMRNAEQISVTPQDRYDLAA